MDGEDEVRGGSWEKAGEQKSLVFPAAMSPSRRIWMHSGHHALRKQKQQSRAWSPAHASTKDTRCFAHTNASLT